MMPNWYGIEAIKYERHTFDKNDIEDGLWQMFLDDDWEQQRNRLP